MTTPPGVVTAPGGSSTTTLPGTPTTGTPLPTATAPPPAAPVDVAKAEPVAKFAADEFLDTAKKDIPGTDAKFAGKVIQLQGNVSDVSRTLAKGVVVKVSVMFKSPSGNFTTCWINDSEAWKNVASGSQITIKGKWAPHVPPPGVANPPAWLGTLVDCVIIEAGPCSRIAITPDELSADYNALGPDAFFKKYDPVVLQVEGETESHSMSSSGSNVAILKTSTIPRVGFHPSQFEKRDPNHVLLQFPIGQRVVFLGRFNGALNTPKNDTLFIEGTDKYVDE